MDYSWIIQNSNLVKFLLPKLLSLKLNSKNLFRHNNRLIIKEV